MFLSLDWAISCQFLQRGNGWNMTPNGLENDVCCFSMRRECISSPKHEPMKNVDALAGRERIFAISTCLRSLGVCKCELTLQTKGFLLKLAIG